MKLDFLKRYRFAASTKKRLRQDIRDATRDAIDRAVTLHLDHLRAGIPIEERTAEFNAGFERACRQLFELRFPGLTNMPPIGGVQRWGLNGARMEGDNSGRWRFVQ
jgi:hypothetical protein